MNFVALYRASFYLMLTLATLVVSIDVGDLNRLAMIYPVAVAVAGAIAFFTVDRGGAHPLDKVTANILGVASIGLSLFEYVSDPDTLTLLALAHFLVYLQLIKMFRAKSIFDDWILFLSGLVQVVVGGVMSQSDIVGMALFAWALCALWVLAIFTLYREVIRGRPTSGTRVLPAIDPASPYPGLIDLPFVWASVRVAVVTLALGGAIFLIMPRVNSVGGSLKSDLVGKHLTGFDDEVQLGQLGEILENDSVVMTIELFDDEGRRRAPPEDPHWRGMAMSRYDRGRWKRAHVSAVDLPYKGDGAMKLSRVIRQQVRLEPTDNPVLFALRPILAAESGRKPITVEFNVHDGSLFRPESRPVSLDYVVVSSLDEEGRQINEEIPNSRSDDLLSIGPELRATLRPIVERVVAGIDPTDRLAVARKLEAYLRDSGEFHYTLMMDLVDRTIDPVADFLINRKEGHCEYFASALTLMLRSVDIPARMINGFRGGDWNELASVLNVRQKHAHSWVEMLLDARPTPRGARWVTLDPTPSTERADSVAQVGGVSTGVRQFSDFVRYVWVFYVVGFNYERQQKFLYEPIRLLVLEAVDGLEKIGQAIRGAMNRLFDFPSFSSLFSIRGFFVSFFALTFLAFLARGLGFVLRRIVRRWKTTHADGSAAAIGVLFYRRLLGILSEAGLERHPSETPREFARRAASSLIGLGNGPESVLDVPPLVVDAYYQIRFGEVDLDPSLIQLLEARLDALSAHLTPAKA